MTQSRIKAGAIKDELSNHRFQVVMGSKSSLWKSQKNALSQGSVLAPLLFNVYTADLPIFENIYRPIHAEDLALDAKGNTATGVEGLLENALEKPSAYHESNGRNANPSKSVVSAHHLKNQEANLELKVHRHSNLQHQLTPVKR